MASEQEKVAVEEKIPLQSDTDAPAGEAPAVDAAVEEKKTEEPGKKGWFFSRKGKKAAGVVAEEPAAEEENVEGETEQKPKKCFFSFCKKTQKTEQEQKEDHISIGINLVDRDEKGNQNHIQFGFEDIFGEADATHSLDCGWRATNSVFNFTRNIVYKVVALPVQILFAIIFGIFFALAAVVYSYFIVPTAKLMSIVLVWFAKPWEFVIRAILDPFFSSCGLAFSRINMRSYGINQQPTDQCLA